MIDIEKMLADAIGEKTLNANGMSVVQGLRVAGAQLGLSRPERLAHYCGQLLHESARFRYDREVWGPTPTQKRYEGRKDLGNVKPGDGSKFRGRTAIQITGRYNTGLFAKWARSIIPDAPDFLANPDLMNTDPWEGLGPLWYWSMGNPTGKSLNAYADQNNLEMITRLINGGLNGYTDRMNMYVACGLGLLGFLPLEVAEFQRSVFQNPKDHDGVAGPKTREAIHTELCKLDDVTFGQPRSGLGIDAGIGADLEFLISLRNAITHHLEKRGYK